MNRLLMAALFVASVPFVSLAHMIYIVPQPDGKTAFVIFSDNLEPDPKVSVDKFKEIKVTAKQTGDKADPIVQNRADHHLIVELPEGAKALHSKYIYGLSTKSEKPSLLVYHPKTVIPGATNIESTVGEKAELEIVAVTADGKTRFQLLAKGKPVADAEGTVMMPGGQKEPVKTDKEGFTSGFDNKGRFAVSIKHMETKAGEYQGKKYEEIRHYATLVVDVK
ncbi:MAG: DUF4198 domain-containing protein [Fimbriiglobus sp.]